MAEKLEVEDFVKELCGGFQLLSDGDKAVITPESLRRNSGFLGMEGMTTNETEFCILMVRLSPGMMDDAEAWLEKAIDFELRRTSL
ncbi:Calcium-binding protein KIC [Linum grandiflorum]